MDASSIINIRLINQQLTATKFKTPKEIVSWMGAMQAQDYNMAKWAIGIRLPGSKHAEIEDAIYNGDIIRTHVLRPTWHFVAIEDIYWMLQLTAPHIKRSLRTNDIQRGLTNDVLVKTKLIIVNALSKTPNLTRPELAEKIKESGFDVNSLQMSHIMAHAEIDALVCSGVGRKNKQTYCLLEDKMPKPKPLHKDEALGKLAYRYFSSHGPATVGDFMWWSGLSITDARRGVEIIKPDFVFEKIDSQIYIFPNLHYKLKLNEHHVHLLSAFDEFVISYKDRKEVLIVDHYKKVITSNGIFKPAVLENGKIIGTWRKVMKKNTISVDIDYFITPSKSTLDIIEKKIAAFESYNKL